MSTLLTDQLFRVANVRPSKYGAAKRDPRLRRAPRRSVEHELEGVVAKKRSGRYLPGEPGWVKVKNRDYWRWELEREAAARAWREREFTRSR